MKWFFRYINDEDGVDVTKTGEHKGKSGAKAAPAKKDAKTEAKPAADKEDSISKHKKLSKK
jgi:hypothetical protein